jgi:HEAT repeat protein
MQRKWPVLATKLAGKVEQYRAELRQLRDWEPYLQANSGLPGPRANLELVQAAGDEATKHALWRWSGSEDDYLALCGAAGLGRFALEDPKILPRLQALASDPRWRVREGVAIALQRLGKQDLDRLIAEMKPWANEGPYVQRAAAAGLCEPPLLKREPQVREVLEILDTITRSIASSRDRKSEGFRVLRQAMGYCWSVAVAGAPGPGRSIMERWLRSTDPDVRWIMKSNLGKSRMGALGQSWVAAERKKLER